MEGDLREFPLAEILQFVSLGSRSGVLEVVRRDGGYRISFTAGTITGLAADGWSLLDELTAADLAPADALARRPEARAEAEEIRSAVLTGGYMTAEEWTVFVARQVEGLLYALFDARDGTFRFRQGSTDPGPWLPVRVTADRAVLEGTRWSETWAGVAAVVPSRRSRFARRPTPPSRPVQLSPTQWRVYVALGEPGDVAQAAVRAVLTEVEVVESIRALLEQDLLVPLLERG